MSDISGLITLLITDLCSEPNQLDAGQASRIFTAKESLKVTAWKPLEHNPRRFLVPDDLEDLDYVLVFEAALKEGREDRLGTLCFVHLDDDAFCWLNYSWKAVRYILR